MAWTILGPCSRVWDLGLSGLRLYREEGLGALGIRSLQAIHCRTVDDIHPALPEGP